jgi:uncharacterized protein involved in outer membrane biogenesis
MKLLKRLFWIVAVLLVITVAVVFIAFSNIDRIVEAAIERYGSEATQTAVLVEGVEIKLQDGQGSIAGLTVANPPGFSSPHIFSLGQIGTAIDLQSLRRDPIVIDEIVITSPQVTYEIDERGRSNVQALEEALARGGGGARPEQEPAGDSAAPNILIRRLVIEQGRVEARVPRLEDRDLTARLPRIELTELGGRDGASPEAIARRVTEVILASAQRAAADLNLDQYVDEAVDKAKEKARGELEQKIDEELGEGVSDKLREQLGR